MIYHNTYIAEAWSDSFMIAFAVFFVKGHLKVYNKGYAFFAARLQIVKMQGKFLKSQAHVYANVC